MQQARVTDNVTHTTSASLSVLPVSTGSRRLLRVGRFVRCNGPNYMGCDDHGSDYDQNIRQNLPCR